MKAWVVALSTAVAMPAAASAQPPAAIDSSAIVAAMAETARVASRAQAPSTLAMLVEELEQNNPQIKAARRDIDASVARIAPAGALPDPTLSVGYMGGFLRPPFFPSADPSGGIGGSRQIGITQELPFPGKRGLRSRVAITEADAQRWEYEDTRRRLIGELKGTYVEFRYLNRSLEILLRNKERLEQFRQIAEARFSVGQGVQQDVLKAQVEISLILERLALFAQQRDTARARINGQLFRPADTPLSPELTFEAVPLSFSLDELRDQVRTSYPALKRDERGIDRGQQSLLLARREQFPDLAINVTSQKYVDMPWMYGVDVMVKLPIFWQRKQRPMVAEAAATLEGTRERRDATASMAVAQVTEEYLAATTSQKLADLYADSVLPQARLSLESSLASYQVGRVDFLTVLTNFMTVLTYELGFEEQTARYLAALARLEPLTASVFIR